MVRKLLEKVQLDLLTIISSINIKRAKGLLDMENITCSICDSELKINEKGSVAPCMKCMVELKLESIDLKDVLVVTSDYINRDETDELRVEFEKAVKKRGKDTYLVVANYDIKLQNLTDKEVEDAGLKRT